MSEIDNLQLKLDAYTKWAWYLNNLLLSHHGQGWTPPPTPFRQFLKENKIPFPKG